ncbi:Phytanoyl-CoA dioxygenase [Nymphaea thermarum]|nr:Phytanoyl-CoA dioxygenase [Nymphaea thermarum]
MTVVRPSENPTALGGSTPTQVKQVLCPRGRSRSPQRTRCWRGRERERMGVHGNLTDEHLRSFHSQGFLVVESFCGPEEIDAMMGRMNYLLDNFDCSSTSIFSTRNQKQSTDDYFYESADKVSFFFEGVHGSAVANLMIGYKLKKAFDDKGILKQPKHLSINKVGHALHEIDPVFRKFSCSEKIAGLLSSLSYRRPVIIQSMYIFKQPGIGGEVVPHQDNSFLYTEPPSCTGLWLALEDATIANGCLWAIPGSHKSTYSRYSLYGAGIHGFLSILMEANHFFQLISDGLVRRFIRDDNGVHFDQPSPSYDRRDFVALEVKAGSLVVLHGDLVHQSFENQSPKSRHAYSVHAVETDGCSWAADNWLRKKAEPEPLYSS